MEATNEKETSIKILSGEQARAALTLEDAQTLTRNLLTGIFVPTADASPEQTEERRAEQFDRVLASVQKLADEQRITLAFVDGNIAGMAAVTDLGTLPDGRTVRELRRVSVLPEFRGKIRPHPAQVVLDSLLAADPEGPIVMHTRDEKMQGWGVSRGFVKHPSGYQWYGALEGISEEEAREWEEFEKGQGWGIYVYDPKQ